MKLEDIIKAYISPIKRFDQVLPSDYTAKDIYNYYEDQAQFNELESFMRIRFNRKFQQVARTQDQHDWLNERAKEISNAALRLFTQKYS